MEIDDDVGDPENLNPKTCTVHHVAWLLYRIGMFHPVYRDHISDLRSVYDYEGEDGD